MMNKDDDGAGGVEHFFEKKFYACLTKKNVWYLKQVKALRSLVLVVLATFFFRVYYKP